MEVAKMAKFPRAVPYKITYRRYPDTVPESVLKLNPFVNIAALFSSRGDFLGTGFYIQGGYLLTAGHVAPSHMSNIEARFLDSSYVTKLNNPKEIGDDMIAYKTGPLANRPGLIIGSPSQNEAIWVIGFQDKHGGSTMSLSSGRITDLQGQIVIHDASITDHESGGPIVDYNNVSLVLGITLGQRNEPDRNFGGIINKNYLL